MLYNSSTDDVIPISNTAFWTDNREGSEEGEEGNDKLHDNDLRKISEVY